MQAAEPAPPPPLPGSPCPYCLKVPVPVLCGRQAILLTSMLPWPTCASARLSSPTLPTPALDLGRALCTVAYLLSFWFFYKDLCILHWKESFDFRACPLTEVHVSSQDGQLHAPMYPHLQWDTSKKQS